MGFLWVNGFSFFHCVASPFHSFVPVLSTVNLVMQRLRDHTPQTPVQVNQNLSLLLRGLAHTEDPAPEREAQRA